MIGLNTYANIEANNNSHSGTSIGQPMVTGPCATGSNFFRIPSLLTLQNGWVLAASDIRWRTAGDSPANLDTILSFSKDNGKNWEWKIVNYFDDMADDADGIESASFIDPALLQAEDGTVHMMVDACASKVGLAKGGRLGRESKGFDEFGHLLVAKTSAGSDAPIEKNAYAYFVGQDNLKRTAIRNGQTISVHPICEKSSGALSGVWVDAWLNLYQNEDGRILPVFCAQLHGTKEVQCNLFYLNSPWKAYPTMFTMHRMATVTEDGLVWGEPQFLNIKLSEDEAFSGVCPGRGLSFRYNGKERLLFAMYDINLGTELASVVFSDDGGKTWMRGNRQDILNLNGAGKTSESQLIALPNGNLRMYSRNLANYISYADSLDGGVTWGQSQLDRSLYTRVQHGGCMVSVINLDGILISPSGSQYGNLVLASYARIQRSEGTIRIGTVDDDGFVTWLNSDSSRYEIVHFAYSCVTQLYQEGMPSDKCAILYEFGKFSPNSTTLVYDIISVEDLLGPGWKFLHRN